MERITDLSNIKGRSTDLSEDDLQMCIDFSNNSSKSHNSGYRSLLRKEEHIIQGKLGEVAFYKLAKPIFKGISDIKWKNSIYGDGNFDFILKPHLTVDVKSIKPGDKKVFFKPDFSSISMLSLIEISGKTATYIGSVNITKAADSMKSWEGPNGQGAYYVDRNIFEESLF